MGMKFVGELCFHGSTLQVGSSLNGSPVNRPIGHGVFHPSCDVVRDVLPPIETRRMQDPAGVIACPCLLLFRLCPGFGTQFNIRDRLSSSRKDIEGCSPVAVWEVGYEMLEWLLIDGYRECLPPTPHVPMRFFLSGDPKQS